MHKHSAALAAALFSVFGVAANDAAAQILIVPPDGSPPRLLMEPPTADKNCGPMMQVHTGLENMDEKLLAMGMLGGGKEIFMMYGDQVGHSWTIIHAKPDGSEACTRLSGDDLKVRTLGERAPGVAVAFTDEGESARNLSEFEYKLGWRTQQSLQVTGKAEIGQFRLYANTSLKTFTLVVVDQEGTPKVVGGGDYFMGPEAIKRKGPQIAEPGPAPEHR